MKLFIFFALLIIAGSCKSQSMFKALPTYRAPKSQFDRAIISPVDSLPNISTGKFQGFRFGGPDVMVSIPDFSIWTGVRIDYVWAVADASTGKWNYTYTVGIRGMGGANLGVPTVKTIGGIGLRATFFNGYLAIGAIYNLTTKLPQAGIGNPAALIPGLN